MRKALASVLWLASCASPPPSPALERGLVAAPEPQAAQAGAAVLREGGNAVDAAIAVHFVLAVTFPNAGNLGGGGFLLVHTARGESVLDYRETAPAAAHRDLFLDARGQVVPRLSLDTARAAGVPGSVAGMWLAHRRYGSLPWARLLEPAIRLAREGWTLDRWTAASFAREQRGNAPEYFHGAAGSRFVQPELAGTLGRIAREGRDGFYTGPTARLIVEEMNRSGGIMTLEDLAGYQPRVRPPVETTYRGLRVVSTPPPSGGAELLELLNMIEPWNPRALGFHSAAHVHLVAEIETRVFKDRALYLGDPDFVPVPVARLVSKDWARERMGDFSPARRSGPPGAPPGGPGSREREETTHFSVVDRWGNAVAATTTLNGSYGSGRVVRGAGFLLNNEMDDFSAKPGAPNLFGVTGGDANAIAPGKRMLSSMCPTIVLRGGRPWLVLGTPGGPTIFTTLFQVIVNRVDFDLPLEAAVGAARFHHQWPPLRAPVDPIAFEGGFDVPAQDELRDLGYSLVPRGRLGDVQAIELGERTALGQSDPRGVGAVAFE